MADVTIPYGNPGVAAFELTDDYTNTVLLRGSHPALSPAVSGEAGDTISRFQVIGLNGLGNIVPASSAYPAIGIATEPATVGQRVLYWYAGHFNADMLVFHPDFDTEQVQLGVFNGAPTPTNIRLSPRFG